MAIPIPEDVRELLDAPNYVHLSTLRADGSPPNWVVWVGLEGDNILVCTSHAIWKAKEMRRDTRVAMSLTDMADSYRMAAIRGRVVEVRSDEGCRYIWTRSRSIHRRAIPPPWTRSRVLCDRRGKRRPAHPRLRAQPG
jgi:pyridoxine/pyridoxamine 5'-phosphate oxidase